jgi:hypothetical protein
LPGKIIGRGGGKETRGILLQRRHPCNRGLGMGGDRGSR